LTKSICLKQMCRGVEAGSPLRILLLSGRGKSSVLYSGAREAGWPVPPAYVDGDQVWFSGLGISGNFKAPAWLYHPASGLKRAAVVTGAQVTVAGPCR